MIPELDQNNQDVAIKCIYFYATMHETDLAMVALPSPWPSDGCIARVVDGDSYGALLSLRAGRVDLELKRRFIVTTTTIDTTTNTNNNTNPEYVH